MPVKIDPDIVEELRGMGLTLWEARHPRQAFLSEKTGKMSSREDKTWVLVQLAGPGVDNAHGGGPSLRRAVDAALAHRLPEKLTGLRGALLKLDAAMTGLHTAVHWQRLMTEDGYDGDPDDFIPF